MKCVKARGLLNTIGGNSRRKNVHKKDCACNT